MKKRFISIIIKSMLNLIVFFSLLINLQACGGKESVSTGGTTTTGGSGGSASLTWTAPTTNVDGTPLTDLTGYKLYYGTSPSYYTNSIDVGNVTTYILNNLTDGITYYFAVTAYNTSGIESNYSNEVCFNSAGNCS